MRPKPPGALVVCAGVVVTGCLALISAGLSAFAVAWSPCTVIGLLVFLIPVPSILAFQQYRAVARADSRAARTSAILLFLIGGLALLAFATTLGEAAQEGVRIPWLSLLLPMLGLGVAAISAAWANLRWSRRLRAVDTSSSLEDPQPPIRRFDASAALAAVAFVSGLTIFLYRSTPPQYAEHVTRDAAPFRLPEGARDVSFCQGDRGTIAFEFSIDEDRFIRWVDSGIGSLESQSAHVPLRSIVEPFTINRYYMLSKELTGPNTATITDGLYYRWRKEDRGVEAAFDRPTGRAYYFAHFH